MAKGDLLPVYLPPSTYHCCSAECVSMLPVALHGACVSDRTCLVELQAGELLELVSTYRTIICAYASPELCHAALVGCRMPGMAFYSEVWHILTSCSTVKLPFQPVLAMSGNLPHRAVFPVASPLISATS